MGFSPGSLIVHLRADTGDQLIALAHDVDARLAPLTAGECDLVQATLGLATILPDPRDVAARVAQTGPAYAQHVLADFDAVVAESSFDAGSFAAYRQFLQTLLTQTAPPGIDALKLAPQIRSAFVPHDGLEDSKPLQAITLVLTRDALDQRIDRERVVDALRAALADLPGATLTGMAVISHDTELAIHRDIPRLFGIAIVVVAVYLLFHFRSVVDTLLALSPTFFSLACLLGAMEITGQRLNLVSFVAIPLLIGLDVDYGIFMVGLARSGKDGTRMVDRLSRGAEAILICAASTVLGFGSICFTSVPAVQSLGFVVAVGVVGCAAGSLLLTTPLLLRRET
jgi:predicted exporter